MEITPCEKCGECCRTMTIPISLLDIREISKHLKITPEEFTKKYLTTTTTADGEKTYILRDKPCPFLNGNTCEIHSIKPTTCRTTPCTKTEKNRAFKEKYGLMTMMFLECDRRDIICHLLNIEATGDYLNGHRKYIEKAADKYVSRIEKSLQDDRQVGRLLDSIIMISVHPAYRKKAYQNISPTENH